MKHLCGKCAKEFKTEAEYCNHACESTGFTPKDADNLGPEFKKVAEEAQKRGAERKVKEKKTK